MIELTHQQQQAVDSMGMPRFYDPRTQKTYVLVSSEVFEQLTSEDFEPRQVATMIQNAMQEDDADDPTLDFYQQKYGKS
jgi:hypothetical protein